MIFLIWLSFLEKLLVLRGFGSSFILRRIGFFDSGDVVFHAMLLVGIYVGLRIDIYKRLLLLIEIVSIPYLIIVRGAELILVTRSISLQSAINSDVAIKTIHV